MVILTCAACGQPFSVKPYRAKVAKYCSVACMSRAYVGRPAPYIPPTTQTELTCEHCGKTFSRVASRLTHGRGKHCSPECQYAAIKARPSDARVSYTCLNCGGVFERWQSRARRKGEGKYCSRACRDIHRTGEQHPQYINGSAGDHRGPNWQAQKRKAKRRDKWTCQHCGMTHKQSVETYGQELQVHHTRPYRLFASFEEANDLSNLVTLCPACHRRADSELQRAERT